MASIRSIMVSIEARTSSLESGLIRAATSVETFGRTVDRTVSTSGDTAGRGFMSRFGSWLKPSAMQLVVSGIGVGLAALPALTGALGAAAGAAFALKFLVGSKVNPGPLYNQFEAFKTHITSILDSALKPLIPVFQQVFGQLDSWLSKMAPLIHQVFGAIGPLIMPLVKGLEAFGQAFLQGFLVLMKASLPAVQAFASLLGNLGRDFGSMFTAMAPAIKASASVMKMLGEIVNGLLPVIGKLAAVFAQALGPVLGAFGQAIASLLPGLVTIGQILGSLAGAVIGNLVGIFKTLASVLGALAPSLDVVANVLRLFFREMENTGVFGTLEGAIEQILPPLAKLVNTLMVGLQPALNLIFATIAKLSAGAVDVLVAGVTALLDVLVPLIQMLTPIAPAVVIIIAALKAWAIAQALLNVVLDANPIMLFVLALAVLVGAVVVAVRTIREHWASIVAATSAMWHAVVSAVEGVWSGIKSTFDKVTSFLGALPGKIKHFFASAGTWLLDAGKQILMGLVHGLEGAVGAVINAAKHVASSVLGAIKGFFGISSPSRLMAQMGGYLMDGLAQGILGGIGGVSSAMGQVHGVIAGTSGPSWTGTAAALATTGAGAAAGGVTVHVHGDVYDAERFSQKVGTAVLGALAQRRAMT